MKKCLFGAHIAMEAQMIDSPSALQTFIDDLPDCKGPEPSLYIDLEGNNLSRKGTLSLVTILVEPRHSVHLIDVTGLGGDAFSTAGSDGRTIRQILESPEIAKVFFDIRNDSDALFGLYGVRVQGIEDLQLMELASRNFSKKHVNGLARCIDGDARISFREKQEWKKTKEEGKKMFDPAQGGSYAVFDQRPLSSEMQSYCVQDVINMPALRELYCEKLCDAWWRKIEKETGERIKLSQSKKFVGKGQHMALGPPAWLHWRPSAVERGSRTLFTTRRDSAAPLDVDNRRSPTEKGDDLSRILERLGNMSVSGGTRRTMFSGGYDGVFDDHRDDDLFDSDLFNSGRDDDSRDFTACDSECGYCGGCDY
jgi:exonuclease 3'-5' domain-containing protein 1